MSDNSFRELYKIIETPAPSAQLRKAILDFAKNEANTSTGAEPPAMTNSEKVVSIQQKMHKSRFWYMPTAIAASIAGVFAISITFVYFSPKNQDGTEWPEIPIRSESKSERQEREEVQRKKLEEEKRAEEAARKLQEQGK